VCSLCAQLVKVIHMYDNKGAPERQEARAAPSSEEVVVEAEEDKDSTNHPTERAPPRATSPISQWISSILSHAQKASATSERSDSESNDQTEHETPLTIDTREEYGPDHGSDADEDSEDAVSVSEGQRKLPMPHSPSSTLGPVLRQWLASTQAKAN